MSSTLAAIEERHAEVEDDIDDYRERPNRNLGAGWAPYTAHVEAHADRGRLLEMLDETKAAQRRERDEARAEVERLRLRIERAAEVLTVAGHDNAHTSCWICIAHGHLRAALRAQPVVLLPEGIG